MARVLVADDDAAIRELVAMACRLEGHDVSEAYDASSAIGAYEAGPPDLLVLDLRMPGGGGHAVLEGLRISQGRNICPVLIVSSFLDELGRDTLLGVEISALLPKPVTIEQLRGKIRELLARARKG